jgi:large conductance mechanosensitive channel
MCRFRRQGDVVADTKNIATEFKEFLLRGNVVDLAVAVVIGAAFGAVVTAFVEDLITPIIGAIFGEPDFSALTFTINDSRFYYGDFLNAVIAFVSIAAAIFFFVVKPLNYVLERRKAAMAAGAEPEPETLSDEALLLSEIRDLLRSRQG